MDTNTKTRLKAQLNALQPLLQQSKSLIAVILPAQTMSPQGPLLVPLQPSMQTHLQGLALQADALDKLTKLVEQVIEAA